MLSSAAAVILIIYQITDRLQQLTLLIGGHKLIPPLFQLMTTTSCVMSHKRFPVINRPFREGIIAWG